MTVKLVIDGAKMAELLSAAGPVGQHLITRAEAFKVKAKAQAPRKTGCLQDSIIKRPIEEAAGTLSITVISDTTPCSPTRTSYSLFVHEGTQPHVIRGNPLLAFFWANGPNGPGTYYFASVNHPGTKANKFFTDNLAVFAMA
jgi:hypothetical protein